MHRWLKGVPGAAPWGRPCTVWNKWIVDVEHVDGTGSRWSRGKLSGRTRPDHGRGSGLRRPGLYPWSVGRREGENRERGCQRRKEKGRQGKKEQCGDSSGTHRWGQGPSRTPEGSRVHLGGCHCQGSTHSRGLRERRRGDRCVLIHESEQLCVQRSCPMRIQPLACSVCAQHQRGHVAPCQL